MMQADATRVQADAKERVKAGRLYVKPRGATTALLVGRLMSRLWNQAASTPARRKGAGHLPTRVSAQPRASEPSSVVWVPCARSVAEQERLRRVLVAHGFGVFPRYRLRRRPQAVASAGLQGGPARIRRFGDIEVDLMAHRVTKSGRTVHLSPRLYVALMVILDRAGTVVSRDELRQILATGRSATGILGERTVDTYIRRLRVALEDDPADPRLLVTVHGTGYRIDDVNEGGGERLRSGEDGGPRC